MSTPGRDPESWTELWRRVRRRPRALLCAALLAVTTAATAAAVFLALLTLLTSWWQWLAVCYSVATFAYAAKICDRLNTHDFRRKYYSRHPDIASLPGALRILAFLLDLTAVSVAVAVIWPYYIACRLQAKLHHKRGRHDNEPSQ